MKSHIKTITILITINLTATCPAPGTEQAKQNTPIQVLGILGDEALINGKWYKAGDAVADAKIVAVQPTRITIERAGEQSTLIPTRQRSGEASWQRQVALPDAAQESTPALPGGARGYPPPPLEPDDLFVSGETTTTKFDNVPFQDAILATIRTSPPKDSENVLVIPTEKINPQDLAAIAEDMSVMCRIFDKKLNQGRTGSARRGTPFLSKDRATEGIYLEGYGALFALKVNFPLAPPPKATKEEQKDDIDHLWEQTKLELRSTAADQGIFNRTVAYLSTLKSASVQEYDAEKVEQLKQILIKTLKHAANIRSLEPDQWITLAVRGSQPRRRIAAVRTMTHPDSPFDPLTVVRYESPVSVTSTDAPSSKSTVLTIRAKKADIDEFANGILDSEQFLHRIRIFIDGTPALSDRKTSDSEGPAESPPSTTKKRAHNTGKFTEVF